MTGGTCWTFVALTLLRWWMQGGAAGLGWLGGWRNDARFSSGWLGLTAEDCRDVMWYGLTSSWLMMMEDDQWSAQVVRVAIRNILAAAQPDRVLPTTHRTQP